MAFAVIAGIAAEPLLPRWPIAGLIGVGGLLAASWILFRREICSSLFLLASLFLAGTTAAQLESYCFPASHIAHFTTDEPRLAELELRVISPPQIFAHVVTGEKGARSRVSRPTGSETLRERPKIRPRH